MLTGVCVVCAITQTQFVKRTAIHAVNGGHLVSSLNALTSNIKLPRTKFSGEMHLPGHSFTGPGTTLHLTLNSDGTPQPGSESVNRVDK